MAEETVAAMMAEVEEGPKLADVAQVAEQAAPSQFEKAFDNFMTKLVTAPPGPGRPEDYNPHPVNFTGTMGGAHMAQGITGIVGNLNLAIISIMRGGFMMWKERRMGPVGGSHEEG